MKEIPVHSQKFKTNIVGETYLKNTISTAIDYIAEAVSTSYGPYGSHSILLVNGAPYPTKDGLKIIERMRMSGNISQTVLHLVHSIASAQNAENGDGSTTMTLLFRSLYHAFNKCMTDFAIPPSTFKNAVEELVNDIIIPEIKKNAKPLVDNADLHALIHTSVDGDVSLANTILNLFNDLSATDPMIQIRMSDTKDHSYDVLNGVDLDIVTINPELAFAFANQRKCIEPKIALVSGQFRPSVSSFIQFANDLYTSNMSVKRVEDRNSVIFICCGISEDIFSSIATISKQNPEMFQDIIFLQYKDVIKRDYIKDLSVLFDANIITEDLFKTSESLSELLENRVGGCGIATIKEFSARFTDLSLDEEKIVERIEEINSSIKALEEDPGASNDRIEDLEGRKAILSKNCAVLYVGGNSYERKNINYEHARDAIPQVLSAYKFGTLDGMNKGVITILYNISTSHQLDSIKKVILSTIIEGYVELATIIIANKDRSSMEHAATKVISILSIGEESKINIKETDSIPAIGSANTDIVVIKNATDMAALLSTTALMLTTLDEYDLMPLNSRMV